MLARYRAAFAAPGAAAFSAAAFVARFPIAIYPIGLVLIVSGRTGHYGFAGVVSGCFVIGGAFGNPVAGTLVDRYGQHRVLPPFMLAHVALTAVFAALVTVNAPLWSLVPPAVLMGFALMNVGALVRARWSHAWPGAAPQRSTAYSVESTLDEVIFVLGPLVATVLATHTHAPVTLGLAVVLVTVGTLWLARQRSTEPPARAARSLPEKHTFALRSKGMLLITWVMVFMGAVFGSAEVVMVAFCAQHGQRTSAGWVIACFAGGSAVAGVGYGARHWRTALLPRFVACAVVFGALPFVYFAATSPATLAACTFVVGLGIAPTLIGGFGLIDEIVPAATLTEGLTWIGTGLSVGYGLGAAVVGGIADAHGARVAFWVPVGAALSAALVALALARRLRPVAPASQPVAVG
ncbi:MAG: MFS transporter [Jatrophihabitantaceae bacterium]